MTIDRAIEILDPGHREHYESIDPVNEACRMGMEALERTRWIPCSERLPERNVSVLGWYKDNPFARYCPEIVSWNGNGWVFVYARRYVTNVTHWQPLPEPPKEGGAENG